MKRLSIRLLVVGLTVALGTYAINQSLQDPVEAQEQSADKNGAGSPEQAKSVGDVDGEKGIVSH